MLQNFLKFDKLLLITKKIIILLCILKTVLVRQLEIFQIFCFQNKNVCHLKICRKQQLGQHSIRVSTCESMLVTLRKFPPAAAA